MPTKFVTLNNNVWATGACALGTYGGSSLGSSLPNHHDDSALSDVTLIIAHNMHIVSQFLLLYNQSSKEIGDPFYLGS